MTGCGSRRRPLRDRASDRRRAWPVGPPGPGRPRRVRARAGGRAAARRRAGGVRPADQHDPRRARRPAGPARVLGRPASTRSSPGRSGSPSRSAAGVVAGVVIGAIPFLRAATATTIEFLRPIPSVALIPLVIVLYGSTIRSTRGAGRVRRVLAGAGPGAATASPTSTRSPATPRGRYRLGRWARVRYLLWPTALPYVVTGVRLAASVALILTVTGELVIGSPGLGKEIDIAQQGGAVPAMYALIVVTGLLGVLANVGDAAAGAPGAAPGIPSAAAGGDADMTPRARRSAFALGAAGACCSPTWWLASADSTDFYRPPLSTILDRVRRHLDLGPDPGRRAAEPRPARGRLRARARGRRRARRR